FYGGGGGGGGVGLNAEHILYDLQEEPTGLFNGTADSDQLFTPALHGEDEMMAPNGDTDPQDADNLKRAAIISKIIIDEKYNLKSTDTTQTTALYTDPILYYATSPDAPLYGIPKEHKQEILDKSKSCLAKPKSHKAVGRVLWEALCGRRV